MKSEKKIIDDINGLRVKIDAIDKELMANFEKRMKIVERIAYIKKDNYLSLKNESREEEVVLCALKNIDHKFLDEAKMFIENLINVSKIFQSKVLMKN